METLVTKVLPVGLAVAATYCQKVWKPKPPSTLARSFGTRDAGAPKPKHNETEMNEIVHQKALSHLPKRALPVFSSQASHTPVSSLFAK